MRIRARNAGRRTSWSCADARFRRRAMELRSLLTGLIVWAFYPLWLAAGAVDYLCHRGAAIEHTSGAPESRLHVAQLACIAVIVALGVLAEMTLVVWIVLSAVAITHSVLAYIDVSYTLPRRPIGALEQLAHDYLEVLPLVVVALLAVIHWPLQRTPWFAWRGSFGWGEAFLLASFAILAGVPVFEEFWRTMRARRSRPAAARGPREPAPAP
jgi:hypothetical protein